jgi:Tol biopolymer transport system component
VSVSRERNRLVFAKDLSDTNIWRVPGPKGTRKEGPKKFIASTQAEGDVAFSPDGKRIAFSSLRTGVGEIWIADSDGTNSRQLTFFGPDPVYADAPQWSPGGRLIAFVLQRSPEFDADVYVVPAEGGTPKRLTDWPSRDWVASWSRDGKWIYFGSTKTGVWEIWKIPADGGDAVQMTRSGGEVAYESPDGRTLFVRRAAGIFRMPAEGGQEEKVIDTGGNAERWDVYDEGFCYLGEPSGETSVVMCHEFATGKSTQVAVLERMRLDTFAVSPDGQWILYLQEDATGSDLVLVENVR